MGWGGDWGWVGVGSWWLNGLSVGLLINRSTMEPKLESLCYVLRQDTLPSQCLSPPKSVNGPGQFVRATWHLQWTSIPSKESSNTPSHFLSQKLEWSTCADDPSGFSDSIGMELTFVPCSQWNHHWNVLILSHNNWKGDLVPCVKQTFHHLSPAPFTEYIAELLSEGGKGHLLTSTFSKQLCNRWLKMGNDRLGPGE